jgi:uncharacterized protein YgiM (DUF1202 family)
VLGYSGRTGNAFRNGAHLHFGTFKNGSRVTVPDLDIGEWVDRGQPLPGDYGLSSFDSPGQETFEVKVVASAPLRAEPTQRSAVIGRVEPQQTLSVRGSELGYYYVEGADAEGWMVHNSSQPKRSKLQLHRVTADSANVRSSSSTSASVVGSLPNGELVTSFGKSGDWYRILFDLPATYKWTHETNLEATTLFRTGIRSASANVRSEPSIDAQVVGSVPNPTIIRVLETRDGWYRIHFEGEDAWLAGWLTQGPM